MIDVEITKTMAASDAAAWCLDNLIPGHWNMEVINFCTPGVKYRFSFLDSKIATYVSLKFA
jgi:hypothetical protein